MLLASLSIYEYIFAHKASQLVAGVNVFLTQSTEARPPVTCLAKIGADIELAAVRAGVPPHSLSNAPYTPDYKCVTKAQGLQIFNAGRVPPGNSIALD